MDKRLIRTKEKLKNALGELMQMKDISQITIKELTDKSNINRGTFYLHYKDVSELVNEVENELIYNLIHAISSTTTMNDSDSFIYQLMRMLDYVKEEKILFRGLTSHHGDIVFLQKLRQSLLDEFCFFFKNSEGYNPLMIKFLFSFLIAGGIGVFQEWLRSDCSLPYNTIIAPCELIIKASFNNLDSLKKTDVK